MDFIFLADVGGTNSKFELFKMNRVSHEMTLIKKSNLKTQDYNSFDQVLLEFLKDEDLGKKDLYGVVAIAGIVTKNTY